MIQSEITVKVASTTAEINALRYFWTRFNYHPEADVDFVLMLTSVRPEIQRPYILVAYNSDGEPVALMVGRIEKTVTNVRIGYLTLFKIPLTQLVLVRDGYLGECSKSIAKAMVEEIGKALHKGGIDRALLCSLPISDTLHDYVRCYFRILQRNHSRKIGEHWRTSLTNDFYAFLGKKSKKRRYWFRRIIKILETQYKGRVGYEVFSELNEVNSFCSAAETVAKTTYQRGLGTGFVDNIENRERLSLAARKGWFRAYMVYIEDKPVAFWVGERVGDVFYLIWTGFNPSYSQYEVGTILFLKMVEDLFAQGVREVDYGLGGALYKERFGDLCLQEMDVDVYAPTLKGYIINLIITLENIINQVGQRFVAWLKVSKKVKRIWKTSLSPNQARSIS
ncbi:GNAT family N-acetyltransferase [Methylobacter sp.]|uniref:GNAT family N-acetyltransferase n=1 Tax=Methylobacter sp. TaxID=2051955 RepID=UPI003DA63626